MLGLDFGFLVGFLPIWCQVYILNPCMLYFLLEKTKINVPFNMISLSCPTL